MSSGYRPRHFITAAHWLSRHAARAHVAAQQSGMDLMLCLDLPLVSGPTRLYLPVTPRPGDTWTIRTVLTVEQAEANLAQQAEKSRAAWRVRKGFTLPSARRQRTAHHALVAAA